MYLPVQLLSSTCQCFLPILFPPAFQQVVQDYGNHSDSQAYCWPEPVMVMDVVGNAETESCGEQGNEVAVPGVTTQAFDHLDATSLSRTFLAHFGTYLPASP